MTQYIFNVKNIFLKRWFWPTVIINYSPTKPVISPALKKFCPAKLATIQFRSELMSLFTSVKVQKTSRARRGEFMMQIKRCSVEWAFLLWTTFHCSLVRLFTVGPKANSPNWTYGGILIWTRSPMPRPPQASIPEASKSSTRFQRSLCITPATMLR